MRVHISFEPTTVCIHFKKNKRLNLKISFKQRASNAHLYIALRKKVFNTGTLGYMENNII